MIGNNQVCSICYSESGNRGCLCNGEIKLLGKKCFEEHMSDMEANHNLIEITLALRMQEDPSLVDVYLNELTEIPKVLNFLRAEANKTKSLKKKLDEEKQRLFYEIEEIFYESGRGIEVLIQDLEAKLRLITKYKNRLCEEGSVFMKNYKRNGLEVFITNRVQSLSIPVAEIAQYIKSNIAVHYNNPTDKDLGSMVSNEKDSLIESLRSQLGEKEREIAELNTLLSEYKYKLIERDQYVLKLEENVIQLNLDLKSTAEIIQTYKNQLLHKESDIQAIQLEMSNRNQELATIHTQLDANLRRNKELMQESRDKDIKIQENNTTIRNISNQISSLVHSLNTKEKEIRNISGQIKEIQRLLKSKESENRKLKQIETELHNQISTLNSVCDGYNYDSIATQNDFSMHISTLQEIVSKMQRDLSLTLIRDFRNSILTLYYLYYHMIFLYKIPYKHDPSAILESYQITIYEILTWIVNYI
jgi:chromosome segregation ATPase